MNVPDLEEEEDVEAVLVVHHDYEGAELGAEQVPDRVRGHHSIISFAISVFRQSRLKNKILVCLVFLPTIH